jgi:hypothetical protein
VLREIKKAVDQKNSKKRPKAYIQKDSRFNWYIFNKISTEVKDKLAPKRVLFEIGVGERVTQYMGFKSATTLTV